MKKSKVEWYALVYVAALGLTVGGFQNCSRTSFESVPVAENNPSSLDLASSVPKAPGDVAPTPAPSPAPTPTPVVNDPPQPPCNASDVALLAKSLYKTVPASEAAVANACGDGAVSAADSYPKADNPGSYVRFFNTCGNRYCKSVLGAVSGRVIEDNLGQVSLTCLFNKVPTGLSPRCQLAVTQVPAPFVFPSVSNQTMAQTCVDSAVPAVADQAPNGTDVNRQIRWTYTCGNRQCRALGYNSGRLIENDASTVYLECSSLEAFNAYVSVPLVQSFTTSASAISGACVDPYFPTADASVPNGDPLRLLRFMNTCGSRYCAKAGFSIGRVTEINKNVAVATCSK